MIFTNFNSSCINWVQYDPSAHIAQVYFVGGKTIYYYRMDADTFLKWLAAPSAGKFYNQEVKGKCELLNS